MGWSFRKSVKLGPIRLNFSKGGVGASIGVRGARIGIGPRGTQLSLSGGGLQYRKRLGKSAPRAAPAQNAVVPEQPSEGIGALSLILGLLIVGVIFKCMLDRPEQRAAESAAPVSAAIEESKPPQPEAVPPAKIRRAKAKRANARPQKPAWLKSIKVAADPD